MSERILVWHIPSLPAITPAFYINRDSTPDALRIHADRWPDRELIVDILDDGVSIMDSNDSDKVTFEQEDAYIEFGTPSALKFTVNEQIEGTTSGATAKVKSNDNSRLVLYDVSGKFTLGETITGASSAATGVVNSYVVEIRSVKHTTVPGQSRAVLARKSNSDTASQDFKDGVDIAEGSWVTLKLIDAAGASNITVQLELEEA